MAGERQDMHHDEEGGSRSQGRWAGLLSAGVAEFFCTAVFVFLATATVTSGCHTADTARASGAQTTELERVVPGACFLGTTNLLNIALGFGLSIFVMVYAAASFSGGHLNPAVTFAMLLAGRICVARAIIYILCQIAGALVGSALVLAVDPSGHRAALGAANRLNDWANVGTALGAEILLTAIFVFVIFAAVDKPRAKTSAHLPVLAPLAIGITLFLCHIVAVPIDGCSVNPARSFGTAAVANVWEHHWIFWVGPLVGAGAAGVLYELLAYRSAVYATPYEGNSRFFKTIGKHSRHDAKAVSRGTAERPSGEHEYTV